MGITSARFNRLAAVVGGAIAAGVVHHEAAHAAAHLEFFGPDFEVCLADAAQLEKRKGGRLVTYLHERLSMIVSPFAPLDERQAARGCDELAWPLTIVAFAGVAAEFRGAAEPSEGARIHAGKDELMLSYWAASRGWPRIDIADAWGTVSAWVERRWPEIEACAAVLKRRGVATGVSLAREATMRRRSAGAIDLLAINSDEV